MTEREWKPGDPLPEAGIRFWFNDLALKMTLDILRREYPEAYGSLLAEIREQAASPIAMINPESEDVDRLIEAMRRRGWTGLDDDAPSDMAAALREFANPTPPRSDEPGTWGIVNAACVHSDKRRPWVRHEDGLWYVFGESNLKTDNPDDWDSLTDPVLVREGVSND